MRELDSYKETHSFDAVLRDSTGQELPVDCEIRLPAIWGEGADIRLAIPHSVMPFGNFENPCQLTSKIADTAFRLEMNEIWYRKLISSVHPSRHHGAAPVSLTHIAGMKITQEFSHLDSEFIVYISTPDLFSKSAHLGRGDRMIDDLSTFCCPKLGLICLQRYWVRTALEGTDGFISKAGYLMKISVSDIELTPDEVLQLVSPVLKLMSLFFRQRIMVLGWESIGAGKRERYWQYPLELSKTTYVSVEPKRFLVTVGTLAKKMESALLAYYDLIPERRGFVDRLSNSLRPTIKMYDSEWFMAMFKDIESISKKCTPKQMATEDEIGAAHELRHFAEPFQESSRSVFDCISEFAKQLENGRPKNTTQCICWLLQENDVYSSDLWAVDGNSGLVRIRNKLAHSGAHRLHHQALAVATFHLSLLNERLIHCMLGLDCSDDEFHSGRDEWLQHSYVSSLKKCVFNPIS